MHFSKSHFCFLFFRSFLMAKISSKILPLNFQLVKKSESGNTATKKTTKKLAIFFRVFHAFFLDLFKVSMTNLFIEERCLNLKKSGVLEYNNFRDKVVKRKLFIQRLISQFKELVFLFFVMFLFRHCQN